MALSFVKRARLARLVAAAELPAILAMAPALLFPTPGRLTVLAAVPIIWLCARIAGGRCIPRTPLNPALGLMFAMVGVSLAATFDIHFSLGKVSGVVLGALLFWAIARWLTSPERLNAGTAAFLLAGAGLAVAGLLGTARFFKSPPFPAFEELRFNLPMVIRGVPGAENGFNPNAVAGCLVLFVPVQVALLVSRVQRRLSPCIGRRWARAGLFAIQVVLLVLTVGTLLIMQSRAASVGLAVAAAAFLLWFSRWTRLVAVAAAATVVALVLGLGQESLVGLVASQPGSSMSGVATRVGLWSSAIRGIQDSPLTGMGMNVFRKLMPVRYPTPQISPGVDVAHAHNHLLQAALDLGVPGLIAYVSVWALAAVLLVMVYRRSGARLYRALAGGLGAGLIAHFVFGMVDAIPLGSKVGVLFWLTLALTVALHQVALAPGANRPGGASDREAGVTVWRLRERRR
jgi:putative inorganic carbon (HCO3(-)) transporter